MEMKDSKDYVYAKVSEEELDTISSCEKTLSEKLNQDIVLIAYQPNNASKE